MKKKILILSGANGTYNLGDDAMFEYLVGELNKKNLHLITDGRGKWKNRYVKQILPFLHENPELKIGGKTLMYVRYLFSYIYAKRYIKINLMKLDKILNLYINTIKSCDLIIFSGMGSMNDIFQEHGIIGRGIIVNLAKHFNKKIIVIGNGIGPINKKINRFIVKQYINNIDRIYVRDKTGSKKCLINLNYPANKIKEEMDLAYYLKSNNDDLIKTKDLLEKILKTKKEFIVINLHNWNRNNNENLFENIEKMIKKMQNYNFVLVPLFINKNIGDNKILKELKNYLALKGHKKNIFIIEEDINSAICKEILRKAKMSIVTRYHAGVFSLSVGTPVILISLDKDYYVQKMTGILEWYGLRGLFIDRKNLDKIEDLTEKILSDSKIKDLIKIKNIKFDKNEPGAIRYIWRLIKNGE